jgi:hypothetical protein
MIRSAVVAASVALAALSAAPWSARAAGEATLASEVRSLRVERDALLEHVEALERRASQLKAGLPADADGCRDPAMWLNAGGLPRRDVASSTDQLGPREAHAPQGAKRVFIHYSSKDPGGEQLARRAAQRLLDGGFAVPELRQVEVAIERPSVRFFFDDDRMASLAIKRIVAPLMDREPAGSTPRLVDMRHYAPKPRTDTLELWVSAAAS